VSLTVGSDVSVVVGSFAGCLLGGWCAAFWRRKAIEDGSAKRPPAVLHGAQCECGLISHRMKKLKKSSFQKAINAPKRLYLKNTMPT